MSHSGNYSFVQDSDSKLKILLEGKSGAGKSTLVKNLFDKDNEEPMATSKPITTEFHTEEKYISKHDVTLVVTDTRGLLVGTQGKRKGRTRELKETSKYLDEHVQGETDILLYCLPVAVPLKFTDSNPAIMKSLQDTFGKDIWKRCKVMLTFSNLAWDWFKHKYKDNETAASSKYKAYLNEFARDFEEQLKKLGVSDVIVKTTLTGEEDSPDGTSNRTIIAAIPAGDEPNDEVYAASDPINWRDTAILELANNCNEEVKSKLLRHRYGNKKAIAILEVLGKVGGGSVGGAAGGAGIGVALGAGIGAIGGPFGIATGAGVGAGVGAIVGLLFGSHAALGATLIEKLKEGK